MFHWIFIIRFFCLGKENKIDVNIGSNRMNKRIKEDIYKSDDRTKLKMPKCNWYYPINRVNYVFVPYSTVHISSNSRNFNKTNFRFSRYISKLLYASFTVILIQVYARCKPHWLTDWLADDCILHFAFPETQVNWELRCMWKGKMQQRNEAKWLKWFSSMRRSVLISFSINCRRYFPKITRIIINVCALHMWLLWM